MLYALLYALLYLFIGAVAVGAFLYLNAQAAREWPAYADFARLVRFVIIAIGVIFALLVLIDFATGGRVLYYPRGGG